MNFFDFGTDKKKRIVDILVFALVACIMLTIAHSSKTYAAVGNVSFGSEVYEEAVGTAMNVRVDITSENDIAYYEVRLKYDNERLQYTGGADAEEDGTIFLYGSGYGNHIEYLLSFNTVSGGKAGILVASGAIMEVGEESASVVSDLAQAPINITGNDSVGVSFFDKYDIEEGSNAAYYTDSGIPLLKSLTNPNGERYRIVDVNSYEPEMDVWDYKVSTANIQGEVVPCITDNEENAKVIVALTDNEEYVLLAVSTAGDGLFPVGKIEAGGETYYCVSINACANNPELTVADVNPDQVFYAINSDGDGDFYKYSLSGKMIKWNDNMDAEGLAVNDLEARSGINVVVSKIMAIAVVIAFAVIAFGILINKRREKNATSSEVKSRSERRKQYFFVIRELTSREIKRKYARSFLGIVWSVLNPLLMMMVMSFIFSYMFSRSIEKFPLYYLTGIVFWELFSGATNAAMTALVDNKNLLLKAKLPKSTFVHSRAYTSLVNFGYTCIAYVLMLIVFRIPPSWMMLLFFVDVVLMFFMSVGIGYILSVLYVFFADIKYLYGVVLRLVLYSSAIFYPVTSLPEVLQKLISFNPIYLSIYIARECVVYGNVPDISAWIKLLIASVASILIGRYIFKKKQNEVMQRI